MATFNYTDILIGAAPNDGNGTPARTAASGSINLGFNTIFDAMDIDTSLFDVSFNGDVDITDGEYTQVNTVDVNSLTVNSINATYSKNVLAINMARSASTNFEFMTTTTDGPFDVQHRLAGDGDGHCDGSWVGGGADLAEGWEWKPSWIAQWITQNTNINPLTDLFGISVVMCAEDGENDFIFIRPAEEGETPLGVTSATAGLKMNGDTGKYKRMYLKDDFGNYIMESYKHVEWVEIITPAIVANLEGKKVIPAQKEVTKNHSYHADKVPEGLVIPKDAKYTDKEADGKPLMRRKRNPDWDSSIPYITRDNRPEHIWVGYRGRIRIRKGQVIPDGAIKMRDVSETVEEWYIK